MTLFPVIPGICPLQIQSYACVHKGTELLINVVFYRTLNSLVLELKDSTMLMQESGFGICPELLKSNPLLTVT
jgi:hypothetical protein